MKIIKINLSADDSLLTVKNSLESIDRIKIHLEKFGKITGLRVNWQKSEIMLVNHNKLEQEMFADKYDFKICKSVKYLGIDLVKDTKK